MEKDKIVNYNLIDGFVDFAVKWCNDAGIAIRLGRKEIEAIAALYNISVGDVLDNIVEALKESPINEFGDGFSVRIEETPDGYVLHYKYGDEDEDD